MQGPPAPVKPRGNTVTKPQPSKQTAQPQHDEWDTSTMQGPPAPIKPRGNTASKPQPSKQTAQPQHDEWDTSTMQGPAAPVKPQGNTVSQPQIQKQTALHDQWNSATVQGPIVTAPQTINPRMEEWGEEEKFPTLPEADSMRGDRGGRRGRRGRRERGGERGGKVSTLSSNASEPEILTKTPPPVSENPQKPPTDLPIETHDIVASPLAMTNRQKP
jgi:hypothetical protein